MQANEFTTCIHLRSIPTSHTNYIISTNAHIQGRTQVGSRGLGLPESFFFFQLLYILFLQLDLPSKTLGPFSSISLASFIQITTIQPNNLTKTIKIFTMVIVFQQNTYIYIYIYILPPRNQKKSCVIGETKTKFFATTVNWYQYSKLLKIKYNILLNYISSFN